MLVLPLVLSTLLYLGPECVDAVSITTVTVPRRAWLFARPWDPTWENRIEFSCEYTISPAPATPPTITWLRGAFADPDRKVIYKWSSSGEVYVDPDFAGRASIESRTSPTLVLTDLTLYDWNRFWCRVTNEEQPDEFGTDEESLLFWYYIANNGPTRLSVVDLDKTPVHAEVGATVQLNCTGTSGPGASIIWAKGPGGCTQGGSCSSYETVLYKPGWHWNHKPGNITISPMYGGRVSLGYTAVDPVGSYITPTLIITDIRPSDAGRYWCAPDYREGYSSMGALNRGAQSVVIIVNDQPSCDGKTDGMYQDPSDCSRYYTCSGGVLHGPSPCLSGLVFNQALQVCDWPYNVACV